MKYVLNNVQMKELDYITINEVGIPSMVLMEKAALSVYKTIITHIAEADKILVVAGLGNNGGDGIAVARLLKEQGFSVHVFLIGDEEKATKETRLQLKIAKNLGVYFDSKLNIDEYTIIVDSIFGIGLSRPITGEYEEIIRTINTANKTVFAVDIPSGIDGDSGKIMNIAIKADYTITFGYEKIGLVLYPGCEYAGKVIVADIGFAKDWIDHVNPRIFRYDKEDLVILPKRKNDSNKGNYGKILVIAGSKNMCGACFLSAKSAYVTGAGLVKVMTVEENRIIIQTNLPEALLVTYNTKNLTEESELQRLTKDIEWASVIVIGPGIGVSDSSNALLNLVLKHSKVPTIIDADGINLLADNEDYVKDVNEKGIVIELPNNFILTPHMKEMSRLLHRNSANLREEMKDQLIQILNSGMNNQKFVLALKDARTIVTDGDKAYINISGNNGMSTGGSGDVLTGIIAGLIAGGLDSFTATSFGVYIHGLAADEAVLSKSTYSLIASDIIGAIPSILLKATKGS